jgi:dihydroorotate dehydrogenase
MDRSLYTNLLRPLLFRLDPESAHQLAIVSVKTIGNNPLLQKLVNPLFNYHNPILKQQIWNLEFSNPIGLAAGFDKNAEGIGAWHSLGFGYAEMGTITAHPQQGNPRPRLFRLQRDRAILNRMGFNNKGAETIAKAIHQSKQKYQPLIPIGINLGKSKITPLERASDDYLISFQLLKELGDYFVINVSSPNTEGLRSLQAVSALTQIISTLQSANTNRKPLLLKIAPDLTYGEIDDILQVCADQHINGIIATNTTTARSQLKEKSYSQEAGGISGAPLQQKSTDIIRHIYRRTQGKLTIIGVGGIDSPETAWTKITAGASLLQIYTGLVYQGLGLTRSILNGLVSIMHQNGINHISEAIGKE